MAPELDIDSAEGREALSGAMSMVIADPSSDIRREVQEIRRAHEQELQALRSTNETRDKEWSSILEQKEQDRIREQVSNKLDREAKYLSDRRYANSRFTIGFAFVLVLSLTVLGVTILIGLRLGSEDARWLIALLLPVIAEASILRYALRTWLRSWVGEDVIYALSPKRGILIGVNPSSID